MIASPRRGPERPPNGSSNRSKKASGPRHARDSLEYNPNVVDPPYRVAAPATHDPYLAAWAVLKRRRVIARVASVGAVGLVAPTVAVAFTSGAAQEVATAVVVSWVAVGVILFWLSLPTFLCPDCGTEFFRSSIVQVGFSNRCAGCGIVIGTAKGANAHENEHRRTSGRRIGED
jgi:predicted RNA-binding Zn-ribbon protein involved in translation (DUF1610 family)